MDRLTSERRSANMARIRHKDTKPEMVVRRLLYSSGYHYRLHRKNLPGKPDVVFESRKAVIFIHGCFWHQHSSPTCRKSILPTTRRDFWEAKLKRNVERDAQQILQLGEMGYRVLVVWECELADLQELRQRLVCFLTRT